MLLLPLLLLLLLLISLSWLGLLLAISQPGRGRC
jgi:hypothetical protein